MTPLDYAISRGRHPMIAFLSERGARRAPGRDDRPRVLLQLISHGKREAVRQALEAGPALINEKGPHPLWSGEPQPLHVAIERNHDELFAFLLEKGADVNGEGAAYDGWSPLLLALHHRRDRMRDRLRELGARVNLPEALLLGDDARVEELLAENPALAREPMPSLASPLRFARTLPALRRLIDLGAPLGQRDRYGASPVESLAAAGSAYRPLVECLLAEKAPAPTWIYASLGMLPELRAIARNDPRAVETPRVVMAAIEAGRADIVDWLLKRGVSPDARSEDGARATLLHCAAWNGNLAIARMLVEAGADPRSIDEEYRTTPLTWALTALERLGREDCRGVAAYLESLSPS
jgi:ankyrin repeat protein